MKTKEKNTGLSGAVPAKQVNYVIIDGKKVSKAYAAMIANKGTGTIIDMRAVLK